MLHHGTMLCKFEESIISGASIFYGSVSNAVIGEAKAVQDLRRSRDLAISRSRDLQKIWAEVTEFVGTQIDDIETYAIGCSLICVDVDGGRQYYQGHPRAQWWS